MAAELLPDAPGVAARRESIVRNAQVADQLVGSFLSLVRSATEPLEERVDLAALVRDLLGHGDHGDVTLELQAAGPVWLEPASGAVPWYLVASPAAIDTIEYAFLEGQEGVFMETRMGFDVDGVEIKARLDFGAKAIDWRGLYKNPGVATA